MTQFSSVKDSGARQTFSTGSVRDTQSGKGRFDLISPIALKALAIHYENGAKKYGDRNWEKGQPLGRFLDSALRHLNNFREGDRSEDHLSAAAWNVFCVLHGLDAIEKGEWPKELNDLVSYVKGEPVRVEWPKKYTYTGGGIHPDMRWWDMGDYVRCVNISGNQRPDSSALTREEFRNMIADGRMIEVPE